MTEIIEILVWSRVRSLASLLPRLSLFASQHLTRIFAYFVWGPVCPEILPPPKQNIFSNYQSTSRDFLLSWIFSFSSSSKEYIHWLTRLPKPRYVELLYRILIINQICWLIYVKPIASLKIIHTGFFIFRFLSWLDLAWRLELNNIHLKF